MSTTKDNLDPDWRTLPPTEDFGGIELPLRLQSEDMVDWRQRIQSKEDVCHGKPCIRGTRIMVSVVLDNLAEGLSPEEIVEDYPPLTVEDVRAAVAYAAALAREEEFVPLR